MRTINFTVKIEDSDFIEDNVRKHLSNTFKDALVSVITFPNVEHLKENKEFKALKKAKKQAQKNIANFTDKNRL